MRTLKTALILLALSLVVGSVTPRVWAGAGSKKTIMTFDQAIQIPGHVLPAGTYTFKLLNSQSDRHIVQVWNANGTKLIATVLAIQNSRLQPTGTTVVKFSETSGDQPEALKAWFYPGDNFGQEFVYPKTVAVQLAVAANEPVVALAEDTTEVTETTPVVAETPQKEEVPVAQVVESPAPVEVAQAAPAKELPKTASQTPLVALLGLISLSLAVVLKRLVS